MTSCVWTWPPGRRFHDPMDQDRLALIHSLLTQAGMIMEDASADAILTSAHQSQLSRTIIRLEDSVPQMAALVSAAKMLVGQDGQDQ